MILCQFIIAHPALVTIIAIVAVIVVGALSFDKNDWGGKH